VRDRALDRLHEIRARHGILIATQASLELMRSARRGEIARRCIYRAEAVAFDAQLARKSPCTFGAAADCNACGCSIVALQIAWRSGDVESKRLLSTLFPRRLRR
jgi:hypothetical protein